MPTNFDTRIQDIVTRAAAEIAQAVRQNIAEEVTRLVGGDRAPKSPAAARGRGQASSKKPGRRARRAVDTDAVLAYVKANPGQRTEQISKGLGHDAKPALAKLRKSKQVKTKGEKRATTYTAG